MLNQPDLNKVEKNHKILQKKINLTVFQLVEYQHINPTDSNLSCNFDSFETPTIHEGWANSGMIIN